ncbi:hypothetical protein PHLCEN_2v3495 [Hermanssonia centrifuga]|uniref:DNA 3'-5' helicase n=1 Tax=Hermanssonia centrifuga TaxID=98765 RepID=A0A2R6QF04_9APHY|nr:hypothetical protein PHLCEN_2v3495 [Hermanssonia centrifuga]
MGEDVLCVSATGDGKSALMYMYSMVHDDTMTLVVSPTNALEVDMINNFVGISAVAINADTMAAAALNRPVARDLWAEARAGKYQVIFLSPETLASPAFRTFVEDKTVRSRLGLFCVDECHMVDEWGADFRKPYASISRVRPWLPEWTSFVALTATLEPGRQTEVVAQSLGLYQDQYHFEKHLDWLIPPNTTCISDIPKTLVYCESIDLGQRVAAYLRSLLHPSLQLRRDCVIRHMHSLNCSDCKTAGLASLYQGGDERGTGVHVSTNVLGVGLNMHDFDCIVCFGTPSSLSSLVQHIGCAACGRGLHGVGFVYVKKSDIEATIAYLNRTTYSDLDPRLLNTTVRKAALDLGSSLGDTSNLQGETSNQNSPGKSAPDDSTHVVYPPGMQKLSKKTSAKDALLLKKTLCPSLRLAIAAHIRGACISRQINIIYQNPNVGVNCERCSTCRPRSIPNPYPLPSELAMTSLGGSKAAPTLSIVKTNGTPAYMKLSTKDIAHVTETLRNAARQIQSSLPMRSEFLFVGSQTFLRGSFIQRITADFHLITSQDILKDRMTGWRYWSECGVALWEVVDALRKEMHATLHNRHEEFLAKKRETTRKNAEEKLSKDTADAESPPVETLEGSQSTVRRTSQKRQLLEAEGSPPSKILRAVQSKIYV